MDFVDVQPLGGGVRNGECSLKSSFSTFHFHSGTILLIIFKHVVLVCLKQKVTNESANSLIYLTSPVMLLHEYQNLEEEPSVHCQTFLLEMDPSSTQLKQKPETTAQST